MHAPLIRRTLVIFLASIAPAMASTLEAPRQAVVTAARAVSRPALPEGGGAANGGLLSSFPVVVKAERVPGDIPRVSATVMLVAGDRLTVRAEYQGDLRPDYYVHTGMVRASFGF